MTTRVSTQQIKARSKTRSAMLLALVLGAALAATAREAEAASGRIVFDSVRTTGKGVINPTGDREIFKMNPDGTGLKQLTFNTVDDREPTLSPDGQKIAYLSYGVQTSNPEGDGDVYVMSAQDGSGQKNLTDNGAHDFNPEWGGQATKR